jgi:phosphoribosylglycinamide formyltransferase-1
VVLVSGAGTILQALLDACADPGYCATVVGVGADRAGIAGLARAAAAGVPTFVVSLAEVGERSEWDARLTSACAAYDPDLVIGAGFAKLVGPAFLARFGGRYLNTHNSLLPSFPGLHAPRDALEHGVKVTGATLFLVDEGVDTGPIVAQVAVEVRDDDTEQSLLQRIKASERVQLVQCIGRMVRDGWSVSGRRVRLG